MRYVVCQTIDCLPLASEKDWTRRSIAEALWRPLMLFTWLLQARLIWLLLQGVQGARAGADIIVPSLYAALQVITLISVIAEEGWRFCIWDGQVQRRRKTRLVGDDVPLVDLIIVSCGEDVETIVNTARAACAQDYPSSRLRVLVGDDGNDDALERALRGLAKIAPCELLYYRRPRKAGSKKGYKAGNMNAALAHLDTLSPRPRPDFCGFLDCDMIVEPEFLRACLGQLIREPSAGVVVIPQNFYNLPRNDPLYQSMYVHNHLDQVQRDTLHAGWETGPGVVFRRQAIIDIGGFDEWVLMEDVLAGMLLNGRGWKTIHCHEHLQWGLVPETLAAHVAQRQKWVRFAEISTFTLMLIDRCRLWARFVATILKFGLHAARLSKLTWRQFVVQFWYSMGPYVSIIHRTLLSWGFLLLLSTRLPLVLAGSRAQLNQQLDTAFLLGVCCRLESIVLGIFCGYRKIRRRLQGAIWLSPFLTLTTIREFLPRGLAGRSMGFVPTARLNSKLLERDASLRAPLWRRLTMMILVQGLWYHLSVATIASVLLVRHLMAARAQASDDLMCGYIWAHALAPGFDWLVYVDMMAPFAYALLPPTVPARRNLLERSVCKKMDVWYPKEHRKEEQWDWWFLTEEVPYLVACVVCVWVRRGVCPR